MYRWQWWRADGGACYILDLDSKHVFWWRTEWGAGAPNDLTFANLTEMG